jgi:PAS domain S-box-containing protein
MVTDLLRTSYNSALVVLSITVATLGSFVALDVAARIWPARGWRRAGWIAAAATAMGGGIFSMHFIAMLAFSLPVAVGYDVPLTLASFAFAIAVTAIAFFIVADGKGWLRLLAGGSIMGLGVVAMHYTGMAAMRMPALLSYDPTLFAASVVIACAAATAALWIAGQEARLLWRAGAALVMGGAISGMHYTGMAAACFTPTTAAHHFDGAEFANGTLALIVALGTILVLGLEFISAAVDRRFAAFRTREADILRLSAQRFEKLVQSSNDLIVVVDRIGTITFAAPSSRNALGVDPASLEGQNILKLVTGANLPMLRATLLAEEKRSAFAFVDNLRIAQGDGTIRDYEATICNLVDEPAVNGIVLTFHGVTERERSAAELRRAKAAADEANRLKSEFIANMNHELRTPLNAILGFSELLAAENSQLNPAMRRDYARDIHRSGAQLLAVINDILDFSKAEAGQLTLNEGTVAADRLVEESIRFVLPSALKKGIRLTPSIAKAMPLIRADERRLRQILLNLLSNAIKFTGQGGEVTIEAEQAVTGELVFAVRDTGIGIPEDKLAAVLEPFFQVDGSLARQQEGTGLGLTIARSLAQLHGGVIDLWSRVGEGTTARLILPASRAVNAALEPDVATARAAIA